MRHLLSNILICILDAATEMTDRVLTMLSNYLLSNQSLKVNETFKVYLKVLSVDHMKHRAANPPRYSKALYRSHGALK